ncbi:hypothetical protein BD414DRAFT_411800 [Trametes punicea]|nr:hypothetical protein BD414DRAFT_411800 [Trametes punicea]
MYSQTARPSPPNEYGSSVQTQSVRGNGARRPSRSSAHASHVEQWRLSVDTTQNADGTCPPAPPTTPTSLSASCSPTRQRVAYGETSSNRGDEPTQMSTCRSEASRVGRSSNVSIVRQPKRNQYFKTKPCRFFGEPTGCVKGDRCNFIHEHPNEGRLPTGLAAPVEVMSEGEAESAADSSVQGEHPASTAATSEPSPSVSTQTEQPKKNFYPVTWRVVGGGVTLGGKREICENFMAGRCTEGADCRFAHPDTTSGDEEYVVGYPEPLMFSPVPLISPMMVPCPFVYPIVSPVPTFALPSLPGPLPVTPPIQPAPTPKARHAMKNSLTNLTVVNAFAQPMVVPHGYSPHRFVDGSTLLEREPPPGGYRVDNMWASRSVARPLSTPPTPVHGPEVGIAKLFAAEMP